MAAKKRKKNYGKKKRGHRKNPKRVAAGKKAARTRKRNASKYSKRKRPSKQRKRSYGARKKPRVVMRGKGWVMYDSSGQRRKPTSGYAASHASYGTHGPLRQKHWFFAYIPGRARPVYVRPFSSHGEAVAYAHRFFPHASLVKYGSTLVP